MASNRQPTQDELKHAISRFLEKHIGTESVYDSNAKSSVWQGTRIDGSSTQTWTTNDINSMPDNVIADYQDSAIGKTMGDGYLGGV